MTAHARFPGRLFVVAAAIFSLAALAPTVSASSHSRDLHVTKECSAYAGAAGQYCTITSSNLAAIPVGSRVIYERALTSSILDTDITLDPPGRGDMAFGHVHLDLTAGVGTAVLTGGTGKLAGFMASVAVTFSGGPNWAWDGTYSFSRDNFYLDKTCGPSPDPIGYSCTVQHSSFRLFPAGTEVHYAITSKSNVLRATITIPRGRTTGLCVWSSDRDAICTFKTGTGRLAHFYLRVVVTANADLSVWYWNGTYRFDDGRGHNDRGRD